MARRRISELALNFDSMTDLITNLAGGLILLVLLLFGLTREAAPQAAKSPAPQGPGVGKAETGPMSTLSLQQRVDLLRRQVEEVEGAVRKVDGELREAKQGVEDLLKKLDTVQPRMAPDPKGEAGKPQTVTSRPPILQESSRKSDILLVCADRRISVCELEPLRQALREALDRLNSLEDFNALKVGKILDLSAGDYNVKLTVKEARQVRSEISAIIELRLVRKAGRLGETWEQAQLPESQYQQRLQQLDPETHLVQFSAYSDSFDLFRKTRDLALARGFDYNWDPKAPGDSIILGIGPMTGQGG